MSVAVSAIVMNGSELRDELVVYTAHHDHLGMGAPNPNGALRWATALAALLVLALGASPAMAHAVEEDDDVGMVGGGDPGEAGAAVAPVRLADDPGPRRPVRPLFRA